MGFFGIKPEVIARKKRIMLGTTSEYANTIIPFTNYDPLIYTSVSSNTTSVFTFSSNIGASLDTNSAYVVELANGRYFFLDTSATKTSNDTTGTIITDVGIPLILASEDFSGQSATIRRCVSFNDLISGGLVVSGAFKSGASGIGDVFTAFTTAGSVYTMLFRTSTTWRNLSNVTLLHYPISLFGLFARSASATGGQLIIEIPMSNKI